MVQKSYLFLIRFHLVQATQPLRSMGLQEKEEKKRMKRILKSCLLKKKKVKEVKKCLLTLDLKPFRPQVRGKHSAGKEIVQKLLV